MAFSFFVCDEEIFSQIVSTRERLQLKLHAREARRPELNAIANGPSCSPNRFQHPPPCHR
jgi:hypothetical protein